MAIQIRKAQRRKAKLRMALLGPSGSGKTMSALKLAFGIGGKVGVIDTENGSADLYANLGEYDVITLDKPYTVQKYREAISAFEAAGYTTIIVDSLTHAWSGAGGLLDKQGQIAARTGNSYTAWRDVTPEHNALVEALLASPCHVIGTMRVKTEYVLETNEKGKQVPRKVGLQPVQRDGMEYEFTVVMDVDMNHKGSAAKDRTTLFDGWYDVISEDTGRKVLAWLEQGDAPPPPPPQPEPLPLLSQDMKVIAAPTAEKWEAWTRVALARVANDGRLALIEWREAMAPHFAAIAPLHPKAVEGVQDAITRALDGLAQAEGEESEAA